MSSLIKVDTSSQTPVYKQIIQSVHEMVESGNFKEGDFIPSMNELANELDISKETVKKAYSILREKGLLNRRMEKVSILPIATKIR